MCCIPSDLKKLLIDRDDIYLETMKMLNELEVELNMREILAIRKAHKFNSLWADFVPYKKCDRYYNIRIGGLENYSIIRRRERGPLNLK